MSEAFDIHDYIAFLRRRWSVIVLACSVALALAIGISLILPKQYTATASILIDAPAGADPRAATAVSPIYLESLKSYERFASSDTLFAQAARKFSLAPDHGSPAIDSLKRRVLKVDKPRDTKILDIRATLGNGVKAQALAQYIAEQTVALNRTMAREADRDMLDEAQRQRDFAKKNLGQLEAAAREESAREPVDGLEVDLENVLDTEARVRRELLSAKADLAEAAARTDARESVPLRARCDVLEKQLAQLAVESAAKRVALSQRRERWDELKAQVDSARTILDAANSRLNELQASSGSRTERLKIVDPGIVPQRPSFPNIPLNSVIALLAALAASWMYLTVSYHLRGSAPRLKAVPARAAER